MDKEKLLSRIGAIKVYGDIARYYLSLIQFILIAIGFVKVMDYSISFIVVLFSISSVLLIGIIFLHVRYVMPSEYDYMNRRDKMKKNTLEILKEMNK